MSKPSTTRKSRPILSIIGAGSVGTAFAIALSRRGYRVASVISSNADSSRSLAKRVKASNSSDRISDISPDTRAVFITTPDNAIGVTAAELAKQKNLSFSDTVFIHTSGALGHEVLSVLSEKGGHTLSVHPIQLFPRGEKPLLLSRRLSGIHFGLDGDDVGLAFGKKVVRELGGKALLVRKELKPLYHVACVLASNYLLALMSLLEEVYLKLESDEEKVMDVFKDLITSTIDSVAISSPRQALTGPIERGDVETVRLHLKKLHGSIPYLVPFYTVMGMETIRLAVKKGSLTPRKAAALLDVMSGYIRGEAPTELLSHYFEHRN